MARSRLIAQSPQDTRTRKTDGSGSIHPLHWHDEFMSREAHRQQRPREGRRFLQFLFLRASPPDRQRRIPLVYFALEIASGNTHGRQPCFFQNLGHACVEPLPEFRLQHLIRQLRMRQCSLAFTQWTFNLCALVRHDGIHPRPSSGGLTAGFKLIKGRAQGGHSDRQHLGE